MHNNHECNNDDDLSTIGHSEFGDYQQQQDSIATSDINSMSAIYSQDTAKHHERQLCTTDILREGHTTNIIEDFDKDSIAAESELTNDTPDIHYLSRIDFNFNRFGVGGKNNIISGEGSSKQSPTRDCNYGNTMEKAYEDFGVERQLVPLNENGKKPPRPPFVAGMKLSIKALSGRPFPLSNPIDVDEMSTSMTAASFADMSQKSTVSKRSSEEDCENAMVELVKLDNLKWLIDCGNGLDCIGENDDFTCHNGGITEGGGAGRSGRGAIADWDGDFDKIKVDQFNFDSLLDVMDYAINGKACDDYDCQTEYGCDQTEFGGKTVDTKTVDLEEYDDGEESAWMRNDNSDEHDSQNTALPPPQKEAVANTDAIRMQSVVFLAPNADNPSATIGFLA